MSKHKTIFQDFIFTKNQTTTTAKKKKPNKNQPLNFTRNIWINRSFNLNKNAKRNMSSLKIPFSLFFSVIKNEYCYFNESICRACIFSACFTNSGTLHFIFLEFKEIP